MSKRHDTISFIDLDNENDDESSQNICKKLCTNPKTVETQKCLVLNDKFNHIWKLTNLNKNNIKELIDENNLDIKEINSKLDDTSIAICKNPLNYELKLESRIVCLKTKLSGTIAELPSTLNSKRYLIFYDNGLVEYISEKSRLVPILSQFNLPHDRLNPDHVQFLKNYFNKYPERDLIRLKPNQSILVYLNHKWSQSTVVKIDASLVEIQSNKLFYLMYRGSYCLLPLYEKLKKQLSTSSLNSFHQYVINHKCDFINFLAESASTQLPKETDSTKNEFKSHTCNSLCVFKSELNQISSKDKNPLEFPKLFEWERCLFTCNNQIQKIEYKSPCGRMLRNMNELNLYLVKTNSHLSTDMFSFDSRVNTRYELNYNIDFLISNDLTKGKEFKPISCVNSIDEDDPFCFDYTSKRIALEDVPFNINKENMDCCSCQDNCSDSNKCKCLQKTGFNSYRFKRLSNIVPNGIYECNSKCKCNQYKCLNRVVQQGIQLRLQVFKTLNKGWGVRCLDDIASGSFIATYTGEILNEKMASEREFKTGSEYFAELKSNKMMDTYVVDLKLRGNVGRFFNHSCLPNMFVQNVFVDTHDVRFPWSAFFAADFIPAGTELCWDYNYTIDLSKKSKKIVCKCKSVNCRKRFL